MVPDLGLAYNSISIHAPARGATTGLQTVMGVLTDFNPRSREGSDHRDPFSFASHGYFNPRSREGSDSKASTISSMSTRFQSTLPRGERRFQAITLKLSKLFQSTLPRGERRFHSGLRLHWHFISIHAPARGATY